MRSRMGMMKNRPGPLAPDEAPEPEDDAALVLLDDPHRGADEPDAYQDDNAQYNQVSQQGASLRTSPVAGLASP